VASASADKTVILWNVADRAARHRVGTPLTRPHRRGLVGGVLARREDAGTSGLDNTAILWNLTGARPTRLGSPLTGHANNVWSVAFSPDGQTLATGSADKTIILWNIADRAKPTPLAAPLTGHLDDVWSVAFSPDGHNLLSASSDRTAVVWDLTGLWDRVDHSQPTVIGAPLAGHTGQVWSATFSPDGKTLATAGADHAVVFVGHDGPHQAGRARFAAWWATPTRPVGGLLAGRAQRWPPAARTTP
jgi:WD40 repeat protein